MSHHVTIIDYGMGNLQSVYSALKFIGFTPTISNDPKIVSTSKTLILPGVGSFRAGMEGLKKRKLDIAIKQAVLENKSKILGICLGMQLLGCQSSEGGVTDGLGLIPINIGHFSDIKDESIKVPHIGFNNVNHQNRSILFQDLPEDSDFYFVHSYRMLVPENSDALIAKCKYGVEFIAAYEHANIFATQFHPEKSQINGLCLLKNFISYKI